MSVVALKYTKEKKVGEGTYAEVFVGHNKDDESLIAVKMIKVDKFIDGLDMSAIREVKFLQEMHHPNVVGLLDVFVSEEGNLNLVLEFLPSDLEVIIKDKSLVFSEADVKSWLLMILRGVHHCHRNFILHRDLKPSNLLIAPDEQLKVADFGLGRSMSFLPYEKMTPTVVTRWYRAPELLLGARHYTGAIDIWAIGMIFAEMMLRVPYLAGQSDHEQLDITFKALGTPSPQQWPKMEYLPGYNKSTAFKIRHPAPTRQQMQALFSAASDKALTLLCSMICMDPLKRATTAQALMSPYFSDTPLPSKPNDLPKRH